jgi:nicotinamidase-related amidase
MLLLPSEAVTALVIVDMQEFFFCRPERRTGLDGVIANINRLIDSFDKRGWPVVYALTAFRGDGADWDLKMRSSGKPELIEGSPETALLPDLSVRPHHYRIIKTRYSAFFKTGLLDILNRLALRRVMVTGAYTHYCVNATVFDAYAHDFVPGLISDAVLSHLPDKTALMVERMRRNGYHVLNTIEFLAELT